MKTIKVTCPNCACEIWTRTEAPIDPELKIEEATPIAFSPTLFEPTLDDCETEL